MKTTTATCQCGKDFEFEPMEPIFGFDLSGLDPKHCEECTDRMNAEAAAKHEEEADKLASEWLGRYRASVFASIPPLFRATDTEHPKFNRPAWTAIKEWSPTEEKPWMGLSGGTSGCKTRIAYLAAQGILERLARPRAPRTQADRYNERLAPSYRFVTAYQITETVMAQFTGSDESRRKERESLDALRKVDLVMIDDLGKGKLSPAVSSELFALIDHRHVNQMAMIWTSNSTPEAIAGCMSDDMSGPFAGRINESSKVYRFK